jgi:ceramide glucosyltransferase
MLVFYFFAAIAVWLGWLSLRGGLRFLSYVRREVALPPSDYAPFVSVIAPCRGIEPGLEENLAALFKQRYPAYEIIFVTGGAADPALNIVAQVRAAMSAQPATAARIVIAGQALDSGQKVHNLIGAVAAIDPQTEVIVFVDTDAQPHQDWLRSLVAPLGDETVGAATGYRWFIPGRGGLASQVRAVWNASIASALGGAREKNFCWGGSTAIRRATFDSLNVAGRWRGTVSDDFTLTRILHEARLPIHFVPHCLIASFDDCSWRELLEFTTRQLKITRVYASHLWQAVLVGGLLFVPVFFGGIVLLMVRASRALPIAATAVLLVIMFLLGAAKSWVRLRAVRLAMANYGSRLRQGTLSLQWPSGGRLAENHLARYQLRIEISYRSCHHLARPRLKCQTKPYNSFSCCDPPGAKNVWAQSFCL